MNTPTSKNAEALWFKLYPAKWAVLAMREPDDAKLGARVRGIILALCEQEQGMDHFADSVMESTAEAMNAAREHARTAARARWGKAKDGCPSNARASEDKTIRCSSNAKRERAERELAERDLEDRERASAIAGARATSENPSLEVFEAFGTERGISMDLVRKCYHDTTADGWKDRAGRPIVNWKAWLRKWTEAELRRGTMKQGQSRRVGGPVDVSDDSTDVFVLEARKQAGEVAP